MTRTDRSLSPRDAWQTTLGQLEIQLGRSAFDTWVRGAEVLAYEDGSFIVSVQNAYKRAWLEKRLYGEIRRTLADLFGRTVEVRFVVYAPLQETVDLGPLWDDNGSAAPDADAHPAAHGSADSILNPRYTFDTFVVGSSNQLVNAAALSVAERPGGAYNPLFIWGDVGLGKTHLLHAIGHVCEARGLRVLYFTSEEFTNDLVDAIRHQDTAAFHNHYRSADVLLVDDIQFIAGKETSQEEFFHTFNTLHGANKQIVLASDRRPRAMATLEERLRSRFEWGLIADIQPPDLETRMAILNDKAEQNGVELPGQMAELIAQQIRGNIRELEGALTQIMAQSRLAKQPLTQDLAKRVIHEFRAPRRTRTVEAVLEATAAFHNLTLEDLQGPRRTRVIVTARQQAMYLAREATEASLPQIGEAMGGRDHTTIMHGCNKIAELIESDEEARQEIKQLRLRLFDDEL